MFVVFVITKSYVAGLLFFSLTVQETYHIMQLSYHVPYRGPGPYIWYGPTYAGRQTSNKSSHVVLNRLDEGVYIYIYGCFQK